MNNKIIDLLADRRIINEKIEFPEMCYNKNYNNGKQD